MTDAPATSDTSENLFPRSARRPLAESTEALRKRLSRWMGWRTPHYAIPFLLVRKTYQDAYGRYPDESEDDYRYRLQREAAGIFYPPCYAYLRVIAPEDRQSTSPEAVASRYARHFAESIGRHPRGVLDRRRMQPYARKLTECQNKWLMYVQRTVARHYPPDGVPRSTATDPNYGWVGLTAIFNTNFDRCFLPRPNRSVAYAVLNALAERKWLEHRTYARFSRRAQHDYRLFDRTQLDLTYIPSLPVFTPQ